MEHWTFLVEKGRRLASFQGKKSFMIPRRLVTVEFSPTVCSSQYILEYSVYLSGNKHCYASQIVTSCKIKHVQHKNSTPWGCKENQNRALRQSHRFWKWVSIKYQTSQCPLERRDSMPSPLIFQKHHYSPTSMNKEQANTLLPFASTLWQVCENKASHNQTFWHKNTPLACLPPNQPKNIQLIF
jgi:hypothetical protein